MVISAIATAPGRGGIAVVRMSGEDALSIARRMTDRKDFTPNRMYPGKIDGGTVTDFGLIVYFRAPRSFTGEDVVEFHLHGGTEIAAAVLRRTFELGARPAERGEFTKRAFLNGKLSLAAAEGMADMINASSAAEVRAGYSLYTEQLTAEIRRIMKLLTHCVAAVEVDLDYPEEDLEPETKTEIRHTMSEVEASLSALLSRYGAGRKLKTGVKCVIAGKPNAGKSTLFNALMGYDRAIVSPVPGTTRDTIEGEIELNGVRFLITDTAGLRTGESDVEREGIRRARTSLSEADLIVYLCDDDVPKLPEGVPVIRVGAKCDLVRRNGCDILLSAKTGEGMDAFRKLLFERGYGRENDGALLLEERHYRAAERALQAVRRALDSLESYPELYCEDLRAAHHALGEVTGETTSEDVVREIFEKFCVGK